MLDPDPGPCYAQFFEFNIGVIVRKLFLTTLAVLPALTLANVHFSQEQIQQYKQQLNDAASSSDDQNKPGPMLASQAIKIQAAQAFVAQKGQEAKVIMRFVNQDTYGHAVIAAYSPEAKQVQLRTSVKVNGQYVEVQVHSFALQLSSTTWLGREQKHIMLMDLTQNLNSGETVPVTVIFRDGSYETVNAKVENN